MCTGVRFSDDEGNMYFGRNLDWSFSYGETILVTPRGYQYDYVYGAEGKSEPNAVDRRGRGHGRPSDVFRLRQRAWSGHRGI